MDTIIQKDLSDLFNININNYYFAAVSDIALCGENAVQWRKKNGDLLMKMLGEEDFRKNDLKNKFIDCAKEYRTKPDKQFTLDDQDILNWVCHGKYNYSAYKNKIDGAYVLHYFGENKPWKNSKMSNANLWWDYAKKTYFFEEIKKKYSYSEQQKTSRKSKVRKVAKKQNKKAA